VAVALAGALVGFGGAQALDHTPSLASSLARVSSMLNGSAAAPSATTSTSTGPSAAAAPGASTTTSNPAPANPAPVRNRAPGANRNPSGSQAPAGNQAPSGNRAPTGNQAPAANQPAPQGQPANSQDQAAIQQAIQGIDDAQVKAVSSNDLSGLTAGATADFGQQQQSVTQDLLDNGVSEIKLDNVEWGPITVNGSTATATAVETWTTTYSDSTTDQSRDRNVYTLVQQNGNWVVQADEHPDADAGFPGGLQSMPGIPDNLLPPGFPSPFQNPAPRSQPGTGNNTTPPVQVQP
jgi:ketosteroid isomerase-like protein